MTSRRLVTGAALVVLLLVVLVMAVLGVKAATAPFPSTSPATTTKSCTGTTRKVTGFLTRKEVQVSVFNAGTKAGLAGSTLDKLDAAGFRAGDAGNAPGSARVRHAVVWTTKDADPAARLVALALGKRTRIQVTRTDLGPGVDVLVGDRFGGLDRKAPSRLRLTRPVDTCQ